MRRAGIMPGMWMILCVAAVCLGSCRAVLGQEAEQPPANPATAIERTLAQRGQLTVREFHDAGRIDTSAGVSVRIESVTVSVPSPIPSGDKSPMLVFGVKFHTVPPDLSRPRPPSRSGFLDFDECRSAVVALSAIGELAAAMAKESRDYTEVSYQSRGGVEFGFYQRHRAQTAFIRVGMPPFDDSLSVEMAALPVLRNALAAAEDDLIKKGAMPRIGASLPPPQS